jgi:hypothetical protein
MAKDKIELTEDDGERSELGKNAVAIAKQLFGEQVTVEGVLAVAQVLEDSSADENEEEQAARAEELKKCVAIASGMWDTDSPTVEMVLGLFRLWFDKTLRDQLDDIEDMLEEIKKMLAKRK